MITISIDENGAFETDNIANESNAIFVAGVIYDDEDNDNDVSNERRRIREYYKKVIADASYSNEEFRYPDALHSDGNRDRDHNVVGPVKEMVKKTIGEFIMYGTYNGQRLLAQGRKGKYYTYVYISSTNGISDFTRDNANVIVNDNQAGNRYFHMCTQIVSRLVLHNPVIKNIKGVCFNLATRQTKNYEMGDKTREFSKAGFENKGQGNIYYEVANADLYRASLSKEMIRYKKDSLRIEKFDVSSIQYRENARDKEFLYLADSICSILARDYNRSFNDGRKIQYVVDKLQIVNHREDNIVFVYDDVDVLYEKAYDYYGENNYYDALSVTFEACSREDAIARYYKKKWFSDLREIIENEGYFEGFANAVDRLDESLHSNTYRQDRAVYIFKSIERIATRIKGSLRGYDKEKYLCKLYDAGISVYCHTGNSKEAEKYFKQYKQYLHVAGIDGYTRVINKMIVVESDNFNMQKALDDAQSYVDMQRKYLELQNEMKLFGGDYLKNAHGYAIALSQQGQIYAFMRSEKTEECFRAALAELDKESADYKITQSYLLHHYIDIHDHNKYRDEAMVYFEGAKTPDRKFKYIAEHAFESNPIISYRYALYILVKGIWVFNEVITDSLYDKLININDALKKAEKKIRGARNCTFSKMTGHPSELIYKYISLIAYRRGNIDDAQKMLTMCRASVENAGDTIKLIQAHTETEYAMIAGRTDDFLQLVEKEKEIAGLFKALKELSALENEEYVEKISNYLTYMYN